MAVRYDGVDDVYQLAGESTLRYDTGTAFSGFAWIRKPSVTGNPIMGKAVNAPPAADQRGWAFNTESISGSLGISFHLVNDASPSLHAFKQATTPVSGQFIPLVPNLWCPVAFTYDGSGVTAGIKLYAGGTLLATSGAVVDTLAGNTILVNGTPVRLGGFDSEFWAGDACGYVLVPGVLTAAEILALSDIRNINTNPATFLTTADPDVWVPAWRDKDGVVDLSDHSGNGHDASVSTGAPAAVADPTVVMDTFNTMSFTGDNSVLVTPIGNVSAAVALLVQNVSSADLIAGVTYASVAMSRIASGFAQDTAGEQGAAYAYLLAAGLVQGAQSLAVDVLSGTDAKAGWIVLLNSIGDVTLVDSDLQQGDAANPSVTLTPPTGWAGIVLNALFSGQNAPASVTAGAGHSKLAVGLDFGSQAAVTEIGNFEGTSVASGWTATSEDVAMVALALGSSFPYVPRVPAVNFQDPGVF